MTSRAMRLNIIPLEHAHEVAYAYYSLATIFTLLYSITKLMVKSNKSSFLIECYKLCLLISKPINPVVDAGFLERGFHYNIACEVRVKTLEAMPTFD